MNMRRIKIYEFQTVIRRPYDTTSSDKLFPAYGHKIIGGRGVLYPKATPEINIPYITARIETVKFSFSCRQLWGIKQRSSVMLERTKNRISVFFFSIRNVREIYIFYTDVFT